MPVRNGIRTELANEREGISARVNQSNDMFWSMPFVVHLPHVPVRSFSITVDPMTDTISNEMHARI